MGVTNRALDVSQQWQSFAHVTNGTIVNGATLFMKIIPYPCVLEDIRATIFGLSGSPTYTFYVGREYPGAGFSLQAVTGALTPLTVGTSGIIRASLLAAGNTLLTLQAGDVVFAVSGGGSSAAALGLAVEVVIKATQDVLTFFNVIPS